MSTTLQLLANYYEAVLESERIYYEHTSSSHSPSEKYGNHKVETENRDSMLVKETISLQRQIAQSIHECNILKQENERQKQIHKTQIALLESKLENARKNSAKSKEAAPTETTSENANKVHLLSPLGKEKQQSRTAPEPHNVGKALTRAVKNIPADANGGLRQAISKNKGSLFDDDTNDIAENSHEASFLTSVKDKFKLADIVLPKENHLPASSSDSEDKSSAKNVPQDALPSPKRKRRLIKKRIQSVDTDSENL
ncbi:LAFA_0E14598g1_1 [Lachancea sp. 'fantastica']|nr:LAFA_0E14598g1_1 [Lachancea sp. 'fantastica']